MPRRSNDRSIVSKARVEDALHATQAAAEEGILPGGGVALLRARRALDTLHGDNLDQDAGIKIVWRALEAPLRQIVANSGGEGSVAVDCVVNGGGGGGGDVNYGYSAATGTYGNMVAMGVLDPCKVTRTALQDDASAAGLILTTECLVANKPQRATQGARNPGMGNLEM